MSIENKQIRCQRRYPISAENLWLSPILAVAIVAISAAIVTIEKFKGFEFQHAVGMASEDFTVKTGVM